jgi:hypothetical protein
MPGGRKVHHDGNEVHPPTMGRKSYPPMMGRKSVSHPNDGKEVPPLHEVEGVVCISYFRQPPHIWLL